MNTQTPLLIVVLALCITPGWAQQADSYWSRAYYQEVSYDTFRYFPLFQQKIDQAHLDYPRLNACLFMLSNEFRHNQHKKVLEYSPQLEAAAWHHSRKMLLDDFFGHLNPKDPDRETIELRAKLAGILNPMIAENIAMRNHIPKNSTYLELAESIFEQWINSEGQKSNILSDKALQLGCGIYTDQNLWYATQCFQNTQVIKATKAHDYLPITK